MRHPGQARSLGDMADDGGAIDGVAGHAKEGATAGHSVKRPAGVLKTATDKLVWPNDAHAMRLSARQWA
jgi:hypothetical protein